LSYFSYFVSVHIHSEIWTVSDQFIHPPLSPTLHLLQKT